MVESIHRHGYWLDQADHGHHFDERLADALAVLFAGRSVIDLGCGHGRYVRRWRELGIDADGVDGNPHTAAWNPACRVVDLSEPVDLGRIYEWAVSIEVAEHVPADREKVFIDALTGHCSQGVLLSWAHPGQGGTGHVNERPAEYVHARMRERGLLPDKTLSAVLRGITTVWWLRHNLTVFRWS